MSIKSVGATALMLLAAATAGAQDARTVISTASKAMGADGLNSIYYFGSGANFNLGQNSNANNPWPRTSLNDYRRTIDFTQPASLAWAVTYGSPPQGTPPVMGVFQQAITPAQAAWAQQLEIWVTPWGFLKGAAANNATVRTTGRGDDRQHVVTWSPSNIKSPGGQSYRVVGYIDADTNLVTKVETALEHPIYGDMPIEVAYSGYRERDGVQFPAEIVQSRAGWPTFEAFVQGALVNPPNVQQLLTPPAPPAGVNPPQGPGGGGGPPPAPQVASEKLAEGVYRITGGYVALVIEFNDHILVFEGGPQNEARGLAIMQEAKRVIPNKPIRYAVLSHHHADHTSGIAAPVAEGATLVVHESSKAYFEKWLANPRTLAPDAIARSGKKAVIETVGDKRVFTDGNRTVELHLMKGLPHADGLIVAYLPKEKIIAYADMFNAPPANAPAPQTANLAHVVMLDNLERLGLDYQTVISVHAPNPDRPLTKADIYATVPGRTPR